MERKIRKAVQGHRAVDGAGVHLVRVLSHGTVEDYDPFLMLDSFDSTNPDDYIKGFPFHPHRGIETISYLRSGAMTHQDHLGNQSTVRDGGIQWMTAGSGIIHQEMPQPADRMLGVQIWLNMKRDEKMSDPAYYDIPASDIPEIDFEGGNLRVLAGSYKDTVGFSSGHHPIDFYSLNLEAGADYTIETQPDKVVIFFTLENDAIISGQEVPVKTAVVMDEGDKVTVKAMDKSIEVLVLISEAIKEPVAWGGPIVMNNQMELQHAFNELQNQSFIKVLAKEN